MGPRTWLGWSSMVVLLAGVRVRAAAPERLPDGTTVVARAATLPELIRQAHPRFVWGDRNLIWVTHGPTGRVGFRMNRAVQVKVDGVAPTWCLLDGGQLPFDDAAEDLRYPQRDDPAPLIVARHPTLGVVYQARWTSQPISGSGGITDQRNVLLLCDGRHRWHLLAEGPRVTSHHRNGYAETETARVETRATWTGDADRPVRLAYTVCEVLESGMGPSEGEVGPNHQITTVRWDAVPGRPPPLPAGERRDGFDPADEPPGPFVQAGTSYTLADRAELLDAWATRWRTDEYGKPPAVADVRSFVAALRRVNPLLSDAVADGQRIDLPRMPQPPPPPPEPAVKGMTPAVVAADDAAEGVPGDPAPLTPVPQPPMLP